MSDELATPGVASALTSARLSLGRRSPAIETAEHLRFQLDHALARDAVHAPLDMRLLLDGLRARGHEALALRSAAPDRRTYLRRPDLGRRLDAASAAALQAAAEQSSQLADGTPDRSSALRVAIVLADGLSALALERHALPLLDAALPLHGCDLLPLTLVCNARVAVADEIGERLGADISLMLIGERPGLSSPDSLGVYITWKPGMGRTDAERNCISNVRGDAGLGYSEAAHRIAHYLAEASRLQITGTALKDPVKSHDVARLTV